MTMRTNEDRDYNPNPNGSSTDIETHAYQLGGDFVITSGNSPGAWIAAKWPTDLAGWA